MRNTDALSKSQSQVQTFLYAVRPSVSMAYGKDWSPKHREANNLFSGIFVETSCPGQVAVTRSFV